LIEVHFQLSQSISKQPNKMGQEENEVGIDTECIMEGDVCMPSRIECMHIIADDDFGDIKSSFKRHLSAPASSLQRQLSDTKGIGVIEDDEDDFSASEPDFEPGLWRQETEQVWPTYNDGSASSQAVQVLQEPDGFWSCRPPSSNIAPNQVDLVGKAFNETSSASATDQWPASSSTSFTFGLDKPVASADGTTALPANPMLGVTPSAAEQWPGQQGYYVLVPIPGYQGTQMQDTSINPKRNRARKGNTLIEKAELERQRKLTEQNMARQQQASKIGGACGLSDEQAAFQGNTGTQRFCAGCGGWTEPHFKFCLFCGNAISKPC